MSKNIKLTTLILIAFFLSACTSNLYLEKEFTKIDSRTEKETVYVENPNHKGFNILKKSEIFNLSENPSGIKHLTIKESYKRKGCGNPYLRTVFTLGLLPAKLTADETFNYSIKENNKPPVNYLHNLKMYKRYSLWEWFIKPFKDSETETKAKALSQSPRVRGEVIVKESLSSTSPKKTTPIDQAPS